MNIIHTLSTHKSLHQLWWLRSIAILCEMFIFSVATFVLGLNLPVYAVITILASQLGVNVILWVRLQKKEIIQKQWLLWPLLFDVTALFMLLSLSGGASNPFTSVFILQVIVAATLLTLRQTWLVTGLSICYYTLLVLFWADGQAGHSRHETHTAFDNHIYGMWSGFVLLAVLVAWFVTRMQEVIHRQNQLLATSEQLALLGGMAASAAHELGTPLSSITLLTESIEANSENKEKIELLKSQVARCKDIISHMALKSGVMRAESGQPQKLGDWLGQLTADWQARHPNTHLRLSAADIIKDITLVAEYALEQALFNLLDNAADASADPRILLEAVAVQQNLHLRVHDSGIGFPPALLAKEALMQPIDSAKPGGMGLGLYLARMVAERLEGSLFLQNKREGGAIATLSLPFRRICP